MQKRSLLALPAPPPGWPLARKGFRPFFLLAAAFACAIVPLWLAIIAGIRPAPAYLDATTWHAHEMLFGFATAVVAGFLLTAVGNWTERETVTGPPLVALAALWVAGRLALFAPQLLPRGVPALVDLAFLPAVIVGLARPLVAAKNRRNFVMLGVLAALFAANVVVHLEALGVLASGAGRHACLVALDVLLVIVLIIAGRVFPMFTRNATGVTTIRSSRTLDVATIAGMVLLTVVDAIDRTSVVASALAAVVGVLAAARAARWGSRHTLRTPLLWILHVGYAWIPLGLLLRAGARFVPGATDSLATHALTVGALGSLTLGMMARVALGHTGRPLVAPKLVAWAFALVTAAAFARALVPLVWPEGYYRSLLAAGALWAASFLAYVIAYAPMLLAPRADGRDG